MYRFDPSSCRGIAKAVSVSGPSAAGREALWLEAAVKELLSKSWVRARLMAVSIKYVTRKTQIQIGSGEHYAIAEIEVSDKRRPTAAASGLEDGMKRMELDGEKGEDFFEMDWRTAVKLVEAETATGNGNDGRTRTGRDEVCSLPSSPGS